MPSQAAHSVWAKFDRQRDSWMPLLTHLNDAQGVAALMWDDFLPEQVTSTIGRALPGGQDDGRLLVQWLAGIHDIGKATPAFAVQVESLAIRMRDVGLPIDLRILKVPERRQFPHSVAGQLILCDWLRGKYGATARSARTYAVVIGGHHGVPPNADALGTRDAKLIGGEPWLKVQEEILDLMADRVGVSGRLSCWMAAPLSYPAQVLVSAVVIVADWIASNADFFPYGGTGQGPVSWSSNHDANREDSRLLAAWDSLGLPSPWQPQEHVGGDDSLFASRFDVPPGSGLRPVQRAALEAARSCSRPPLMIIEAPMGEGKTEAALAAAEVLALRFRSGGVFIALPTMATSDAMFSRVNAWVHCLPTGVGEIEQPLFLAHGKAALNPEFSDLPRDLRWGEGLSSIDVDGEIAADNSPGTKATVVAIAHAWLRGRKKGVLSPFVVGTIDQVLFGALRSRHLALRHLAFAGKVVIIDEVHAVDLYMGTYLMRVMEWLAAYGVPTVLLSATLTGSQRTELIGAYEHGRSIADGQPLTEQPVAGATGYPCVTTSTGPTPSVVTPPPSGRTQRIDLVPLPDDDLSLVATLRELLRDGGCAGVVRNTVRRAQDTAELLLREFDCEVILVHSRFVAPHRAHREAALRSRLGPPGRAGVQRPKSLIVVGTQVIEQSLDIDLDVLISDLAPVDLLLQRIGRLHRHRRGDAESDRPVPLQRARCFVTGVDDWLASPPDPVRGSVAVYGHATLLRALIVLREILAGKPLELPDDIPNLVDCAYQPDLVAPPGWETSLAAADKEQQRRDTLQRDKAGTFRLGPVRGNGESLVGWLAHQVGEVEDSGAGQAQVRDTDPSVEVVLTLRVAGEIHRLDEQGRCGPVIPTAHPPGWAAAKQAAACTLRLPVSVTNARVIDSVLTSLERTQYPGWQDSPWLAGQLVLELDENWSAELGGRRFTYDQQFGLLDVAVHTERTS